MALEIERKFLVGEDVRQHLSEGIKLLQGYIDTTTNTTVRARIQDERGFLTIKGESSADGLVRSEFEYEIPLDDARSIIDQLCGTKVLEKTRYEVSHQGRTWEVDLFGGPNQGLMMAEVEISSPGDTVEIPGWVIREVTGDVRYYNRRLIDNPRPDLD